MSEFSESIRSEGISNMALNSKQVVQTQGEGGEAAVEKFYIP